MQILEFIGRIFISLIFLIAGVGKIFNYEGTIGYMESFGIPDYLLIPAIIIEILFPLLVIIGYKTKLAAIILALFTISLAIIFHTDFSNQMQLMSFLKNLAIAGGFLIIFARGAGKYSIDQRLN
jgi:putative oxidoreductase